MVRITVFLGNEEIFLLLFELMISQVFKPFGTLQCWKFSLNSANSAAVFSNLYVLLARSSPLEPRFHDQGLLVPGLSENTKTVYWHLGLGELLHAENYSREILVVTWPYVYPSHRPTICITGRQCEMSHFLANVGTWNLSESQYFSVHQCFYVYYI